jgi:hypothetical protein
VAAATCPACGATIAEPAIAADLVIPGVTSLHPALAALDAQPWRIPRASQSQAFAGGAVVATAAGGPAGLLAAGALTAIAAGEYLAAGRDDAAAIGFNRVGELPAYVQVALGQMAKDESGALPASERPSLQPHGEPGSVAK